MLAIHGGIAQLARAFGSYPKCRWFKSDCRYHAARWSRGLRHRPFTAVTRVRIPSGSPKRKTPSNEGVFLFLRSKRRDSNQEWKRTPSVNEVRSDRETVRWTVLTFLQAKREKTIKEIKPPVWVVFLFGLVGIRTTK